MPECVQREKRISLKLLAPFGEDASQVPSTDPEQIEPLTGLRMESDNSIIMTTVDVFDGAKLRSKGLRKCCGV